MYMTTWKLIALRFFMTTLGRWGWFAEHFKKWMVHFVVVKKKKDRYVASSRYFTLDQLYDPNERRKSDPKIHS